MVEKSLDALIGNNFELRSGLEQLLDMFLRCGRDQGLV